MPKISVIIPVYNVEKYLRECLDSVLTQTYPDFEVLLVNDGSTDSSGDICDEYAVRDSRVRVFHKVNGGVSAARNLGIDNAKGEWVCFVDSDDYIQIEFLESLIKQLNKLTADIYIQGFTKFFSDKSSIQSDLGEGVIKLDDLEVLFEKKKIHNFGFPFSKLFNRAIIENYKIEFPVQYTIAEDLAFFLRYISKSKEIYFLKEHNYFYRQTDGSLSNRLRDPETYFNRYFGLKNIIKELFPTVHQNISQPDSIYKSLKHSIGSSLFQSILSLYFHNLEAKKRITYLSQIKEEEKNLIKDYKKSFRNPIFKIALHFIQKGQLRIGDVILSLYFHIRKAILQTQGKPIHYKFKK